MCQTSSSDAPLVIDNETKTKTISTSQGASGLPPLRLPKRLACIHINSPTLEQCFDEQCVEGGIQSQAMCSIWQGLRRRSGTLDRCGHMLCERCLKQHYETRSAPQAPWTTVKAAPCPACMHFFMIREILTWQAWQRWRQLAFNGHTVRCPNGCAFVVTTAQMNDNEARVCQLRVIGCPVDGCHMRGPEVEIEHQHFPHCPLLRVHCTTCNLPERVKKLGTHECVKELKLALMSMI